MRSILMNRNARIASIAAVVAVFFIVGYATHRRIPREATPGAQSPVFTHTDPPPQHPADKPDLARSPGTRPLPPTQKKWQARAVAQRAARGGDPPRAPIRTSAVAAKEYDADAYAEHVRKTFRETFPEKEQ